MDQKVVYAVDEPLYKQIKEILLKAIKREVYKEKLPTERELAKQFNVSVITIKQALNELVYEGYLYKRPRSGTFIKDINVKKNTATRNNIGFIISREIKGGISNPYYSGILQTVEQELQLHGYITTFLSIENGMWIENTAKNRIEQKDFDGFLITGFVNNAFIDYLLTKKSRIVVIDFPVDYPNVGNILVNNEDGAYKMTEYLYGLGHRKIAYIGGHIDDICSKERYQGYQRVLQEHKIPLETELIRICGLEMEDGYTIAPQIFSARIKPTAIFCVCDKVALGIMRYAQENRIRIPEDISITGFDNIEASRDASPALTTVDINKKELGRQSVNKLLQIISNKDMDPGRKIILDTELVIRDSCRKLVE